MNMAIINLKLKTASVFTSVKERIRDFFIRPRYVSGITVIELVLILVRNFTPYLGCVLCG